MGAGSLPQLTNGYRDQVGAHESPWTKRTTAVDILLNNLGVGLFLVATVCVLVDRDRFAGAVHVAWLLAFAIIAVDLLVLAADLGDPTRAFHMLRVVKPETPMSVGVWSLSAVMALLAVCATVGGLAWFTGVPGWLATLSVILATIALVPGALAILYKGVLFSTTAQPGWREARWFGAHVCASGLLLGTAVLLVIAAALANDAAERGLRAALVALAVVDLGTFALLRRDLAREQRRRAEGQSHRWLVGWSVVPVVVAAGCVLIAGGPAVAGAAAVALIGSAYAVRRSFVSVPRRDVADGQRR